MAATPDGKGYWLVASDGGVFTYGDAGFYGSTGGLALNRPDRRHGGNPGRQGLLARRLRRRHFAFGDAGFHGSTRGHPLNKPIVGMAATPTGKGYWLVAATAASSPSATPYSTARRGACAQQAHRGHGAARRRPGYWLVASDGGIFSSATPASRLDWEHVPSTSRSSAWRRAERQGVLARRLRRWIFNYGDAPFQGSAGSLTLNKPVVGMAAG